MKKITAFVLITMMILGLAACGGESSSSSGAALTEERMKGSESEAPSEALNGDQHQRTEETQAETSGVSSEGNGSDILIAYFTMPLRYNYDKPEKPHRIKGFEVFSLSFSSFSKPKNHTEISRIAGGVSLTTNE